MSIWRRSRVILVAIGIYLAIAALSLVSGDFPIKPTSGWDKLDHTVAYFVVVAFASVLVSKSRYLIGLGLATVCYAGNLVIGQAFVPGREMSFADFFASTLGVVLGMGLASLISIGMKKWAYFLAPPAQERRELS